MLVGAAVCLFRDWRVALTVCLGVLFVRFGIEVQGGQAAVSEPFRSIAIGGGWAVAGLIAHRVKAPTAAFASALVSLSHLLHLGGVAQFWVATLFGEVIVFVLLLAGIIGGGRRVRAPHRLLDYPFGGFFVRRLFVAQVDREGRIP